MPSITFSGRIKEAAGGTIHLSISGANHFFFSNSYTDDFDEVLNLNEGTYSVAISAYTDGKFTFDIKGGKTDPKVPDQFTNKVREVYLLSITKRKKQSI